MPRNWIPRAFHYWW